MIAIAGEELGAEEFMADYWQGELYFDLDRNWWRELNGQSQGMIGGAFSYFTGSSVASNVKKFGEYETSLGRKIPDSGQGSGTKLGGVFVFGKGETGLIHSHQEKSWGDAADVAKIADALQRV